MELSIEMRNFFGRLITVAFVLLQTICLPAQPSTSGLKLDGGRAVLTLYRNITEAELAALREHYELDELPMEEWVDGKGLDNLDRFGWKLEKVEKTFLQLSRSIESLGDISKPEKKLLISSRHASGDELFPLVGGRKDFGFNQLRQTNIVVINGKEVTFFLAGFKSAKQVKLAGSFTRWEQQAQNMVKGVDGWYLKTNLEPGKYFYKFVVDGTWLLHKENLLKENDGKGNVNSVLYVPNHIFELKGHSGASTVYLSGSFNGWSRRATPLVKQGDKWQLPVFLPEGTHTYRFIVDGNWMADPGNKDRLPNEYGEYNSVVRIGKAYLFRLDGFMQAKEVILVGSFNGWRQHELKLQQRNGGWELPYSLGAGNHEYYYLVDGARIGPKPTPGKNTIPLNFSVVISGNYNFILKGYSKAANVYLTGSFNNWSQNGFPMKLEQGAWKLPAYLASGKHLYKFIIDGKWIIDPENPLWEENEYGTKNSVLWIDGD